MKKINRTKLALILLLTLCILVPTSSAKRKTMVKIITMPDFDFIPIDNSEVMPNGFVDVDICYKFFFYAEDMTYLGYAYQYITGITKENLQMLHGYGVFTSEIDGKPGTITYKIGNIYQPNDPEDFTDDVYWGGHLKICSGTDYFEGLKGQGVLNFEEFVFELYLDYNPWE